MLFILKTLNVSLFIISLDYYYLLFTKFTYNNHFLYKLFHLSGWRLEAK